MKHARNILESVRQVGGSTITSYRTEYVEVPVEDEVHIAPTPVIREDTRLKDPLGWVVDFDWSAVEGVNRPNTGGIACGPGPKGKRLAERLAAATRAGVVHYDAHKATDVAGNVYVAASSRVMGRYLNADLRRLGF